MMRSLFSGVAGLKTHQIKMDVIGNNIANVNTVGYKSQSIVFTELMYQTTQRASGPNGETGKAGMNAKQIGLGVMSGAINTAVTQEGSTQNTGNAFDVRITGESFFVVSNGSGYNFTRDGSFYVDAAGNLAMSSTGYNVMGWLPDPITGNIVQDTVQRLQILSAENLTSNPQATEKARFTGIIDRNDTNVLSATGKAMNFSFYDNLGYTYNARFKLKATDEKGIYVLTLDDVLQGKESILDEFDASIFVGANTSGSSVNAAKKNNYSTVDGYSLNFTTDADGNKVYDGTITVTDPNGGTSRTLDPADIFNADGTVKAGQEENANEYAAAFGLSSYKDLLALTVNEATTNGGTTTVAATSVLKALLNDGAYTNADGDTVNLFDGGTLNVDGFTTDAGTSVKLTYDAEKGTFVGLNGTTNLKEFNFLLTPKDATAKNPFKQIAMDLSASLNLNNEKTSTISPTYGDKDGNGAGCALGKMTGVSIQNDGKIYGAYDNGQTKLLGQIAVANFANAAGLEKTGDNLYQATLNSGEFDGIGVDVSSDGGSIRSGVLEMSNVDLSTEFTELITTQRGFQANSRIITVSDTLLEELVNLKR
ncbi:MAG: flagellar hook-basal body complex protein [Lachnospiraceae bacterium]|nr:flagellar hook-basal body complex protein [Lachnospiraceae bacterium]